MRMEIGYLAILTSTIATVSLIGCAQKAEVEDTSPTQDTQFVAALKPKYCLPSYGTLTTVDGNYILKFPDLGEDPVPMTGTYEDGILSLTGQLPIGADLNIVAGAIAGAEYLAMTTMVMSQGQIHHMTQFLGSAGDCPEVDINQLPKIAGNPVNLDDIAKISRYRSSAGHNSGDASENGRSLKHYFEPVVNSEQTVEIFAPMRSVVVALHNDDGPVGDDGVNNQHISLQSITNPGVQVDIFHSRLAQPLVIGQLVEEGQLLGWGHFLRNGQQSSNFDIAVYVSTAEGKRNASLFDILNDEAFAEYIAWSGLNSREDYKIPKALRDANPLQVAPHPFPYSGQFIDQDNDPLIDMTWVEAL